MLWLYLYVLNYTPSGQKMLMLYKISSANLYYTSVQLERKQFPIGWSALFAMDDDRVVNGKKNIIMKYCMPYR